MKNIWMIAFLSLLATIASANSIGQRFDLETNEDLEDDPEKPIGEPMNQTQSLILELKSQLRTEILKRLGMSSEPKVNKLNMSTQERRQILRLYKKSVEELREKTLLLLDEDSFFASQFHSYNDNGTSSKRSIDLINHYRSESFRNDAENTTEDCTIEGNETRCCRYPIFVSFKDMNWDTWIIEPAGYMMYYCYGECPEGFKSANQYSDFMSRVLATNTGLNPDDKKRLSLKCVPSELGPLTLAYLNRDSISNVTVLNDMIPLGCHCL